MQHQTSMLGAPSSAMASASGEGCSLGDLRCLGSMVAKEEAGAESLFWLPLV